MDFTHSQIIDAYTNALLPFAGEISIDNPISDQHQIETLSVVLNSVSAINDIIPVDLLRSNNFEINNKQKHTKLHWISYAFILIFNPYS